MKERVCMLGYLFTMIISIIVPIVFLIYAIKRKNALAYFLGVAAFTLSQLMLRIPLITYLERTNADYTFFQMTNPILFSIALGLSAGVFEEVARYVLMRFVMYKKTWQAGFFFGAGHGAIEAVALVGIPFIGFLIVNDYAGVPSFSMGLAGVERIFAIMLHIGLSLIVLQGIKVGKIRYLFIAIFIHGFIDALVGILPIYLGPTANLIAIESSLLIVSIAVFIYGLSIRKRGVFYEKNLPN